MGARTFWARVDAERARREGREECPTHCDHGVPMGNECRKCRAQIPISADNETPWGETGSAF